MISLIGAVLSTSGIHSSHQSSVLWASMGLATDSDLAFRMLTLNSSFCHVMLMSLAGFVCVNIWPVCTSCSMKL